MLVDLDVLVAPGDETRLAERIHSSVSRIAPGPTYALGEPAWQDRDDAEDLDEADLGRQWAVEHPLAAAADRRVRRFSMSVVGDGVADLLKEIAWAAIGAVCPGARDEDRRTGQGETVPVVADEFPWSSATRVVSEADTR